MSRAPESSPEVLDLEHRLFAGYVDALVAYAGRGLIVIGETIIMNESDWNATRVALTATPGLIVRLVCPLPILLQREQSRRTTYRGTAEDTLARELDEAEYDLTIDTHQEGPAVVVATIEAALRRFGFGS